MSFEAAIVGGILMWVGFLVVPMLQHGWEHRKNG
jgi:hypothetical protein